MTIVPDHPLHEEKKDPRNELSGWIVSHPADQQRLKFRALFYLYRLLVEKTGEDQPKIPVLMMRWLLNQRKTQKHRSIWFSDKVAFIDGRYFWRPDIPGFAKRSFRRYLENEIDRDFFPKAAYGAPSLHLSVTARSPMFYYPRVSQKTPAETADVLSRADLISIVQQYQDSGTSVIYLGGGEPLIRLDDIYAILEAARPGTDFWLETTGFSLTDDKALKLKALGLTGVSIRLNHYHEKECDEFRDYPTAFDWAVRAAVAAHRAGLATALSYYTSSCFTNAHDIEAYMELAKKLGVAFVEFIPPAPRDRAAGKGLSEEQIDLLRAACLLYNSDPAYADYPIVVCDTCREGRKTGEREELSHLFVDAAGGVHTCRFDEKRLCQVNDFPPELTLQLAEVLTADGN